MEHPQEVKITMLLVKLQTEADISNYIPPEGYVVLFAQELDGVVSIMCKNHDGTILQISGSPKDEPGDYVELDVENNSITIQSSAISEEDTNTLEIPNSSIDEDVIVIH